MIVSVDLHSHSGYSGGVGQISLDNVANAMTAKGIDVYGTGDCLHKKWKETLKRLPFSEGLLDYNGKKLLLQTELIFTAAVGEGRKSVHTVFLFPSFDAVEKTVAYLEKIKVKNTIGRPFVKCANAEDVGGKLNAILDLGDIEAIPAHVLTPDGVYGSKNPINFLSDFYGDASRRLSVVETGLSADPNILSLIPELDKLSLVSNSDGHSPALNRLGREFTNLNVSSLNYGSIIGALRGKKVAGTAEFSPSEGRYFLTGHRAGKAGHGKRYCVYSPKLVPQDNLCQICHKKLTVGVLQRAYEVGKAQGEERSLGSPRQPFVSTVPLIELIAYTLGSTVSSKKAVARYNEIISQVGRETRLWFMTDGEISGLSLGELGGNIIKVKTGDFSFDPPGYDGVYGTLSVGKRRDFESVSLIT